MLQYSVIYADAQILKIWQKVHLILPNLGKIEILFLEFLPKFISQSDFPI